MPKKLDLENPVKWTGILDGDDLDVLNAAHPGDVTAVVRALVGQYAASLRARLLSAAQSE